MRRIVREEGDDQTPSLNLQSIFHAMVLLLKVQKKPLCQVVLFLILAALKFLLLSNCCIFQKSMPLQLC